MGKVQRPPVPVLRLPLLSLHISSLLVQMILLPWYFSVTWNMWILPSNLDWLEVEKCHHMARINYKMSEKKLRVMVLRILQHLKLRLSKCCLVGVGRGCHTLIKASL